jgi:probable HAF family extracellular repeat protein
MKSIRFASILMTAGWMSAGPIYNVIGLGSLGGSSAGAFGLNAGGLAVGSATTPFGYTHAYSSSGNGVTDLTINSTASEGIAAGVNNGGQIVGTQYISGQAYASEWVNGSAAAIGGAGSYGLAINNAGQAAGMMTVDGQGHAFVTINGIAFDLGTLAGGDWSSAYAINSAGEVAGYGNTGSGSFRGFVGSQELGTLGGANSYAMAINDQGQAAGSAQTSSGYMSAVLWTNGSIQDLGTLGGTNSYAYGLNSSGEVVGYSYVNGSGNIHAFLFENGVMYDLNNLIDASSEWVLTEAYAINASGEIAGEGLFNGVDEAFLLNPVTQQIQTQSGQSLPAIPEPATWVTIATGLLGVISLRFLLPLLQRRLVPQRAHSRSDVSPR